jgi:DNA-binding protein HU-beta
MKLADLTKKIATHAGIPASKVTPVLDSLAEVAAMELSTGGEVPLPGLGKLFTKSRSARTGRNPKTGEAVQIAESKSVKFKVSTSLKQAVQ